MSRLGVVELMALERGNHNNWHKVCIFSVLELEREQNATTYRPQAFSTSSMRAKVIGSSASLNG
jgi:hypothetical protein